MELLTLEQRTDTVPATKGDTQPDLSLHEGNRGYPHRGSLDDASVEGNGTGRCRRRRGQRTSQGFLPVQVRNSWQSTFTGARDPRPLMTRSGVKQRCRGREAAFRSGREPGGRTARYEWRQLAPSLAAHAAEETQGQHLRRRSL
uniref:Uncharacterized protein n=1 Tax=Aegilops tauschii subsp. strangulata TaxID=200361 RepID=A0A453J726_AEGTS